MNTKLFDGVAPLANDDQIIAAITDEADPWGGGGNAYMIGIRNDAGILYRCICADGFGETVHIMESLKRLGFFDELDQVDGMREKCDSIMRLKTF